MSVGIPSNVFAEQTGGVAVMQEIALTVQLCTGRDGSCEREKKGQYLCLHGQLSLIQVQRKRAYMQQKRSVFLFFCEYIHGQCGQNNQQDQEREPAYSEYRGELEFSFYILYIYLINHT